MADETIVAVYDTSAHAQAAVSDLRAANIAESAISVQSSGSTPGTGVAAPAREQGFWASLFGGEPDHDMAVYDRSVQGGAFVVSVKSPGQQATLVLQILEAHDPIDIDERANSYGLNQTTDIQAGTMAPVAPPRPAATAAATNEGGTIQLAEEQLTVGKRLVNRGGTRIRRFVVETPVERQVTLHDEQILVERRPVTDGRPAIDADFSDKVIEATATSEEAVIGKTARVVEEIALSKQAMDRVETIHDTVRKEQVEIEEMPGETMTSGATLPGQSLSGQSLSGKPGTSKV